MGFILEVVERLNNLLNEYRIPIALSFVGLILIAGGIFSSGLFKTQTKSVLSAKDFPKESMVNSTGFKVDISGAVNGPGVYEIVAGERVEDLIKKAGGFSASASAEYISKNLNLSQKLSDGMKIYVPFEGESGGFVKSGAGVVSTDTTQAKVGINSSTLSELDTLPGVGPVTAQKIIDGRPYGEVNDLIIKKVVSKSVFEKIKDLVDLN